MVSWQITLHNIYHKFSQKSVEKQPKMSLPEYKRKNLAGWSSAEKSVSRRFVATYCAVFFVVKNIYKQIPWHSENNVSLYNNNLRMKCYLAEAV